MSYLNTIGLSLPRSSATSKTRNVSFYSKQSWKDTPLSLSLGCSLELATACTSAILCLLTAQVKVQWLLRQPSSLERTCELIPITEKGKLAILPTGMWESQGMRVGSQLSVNSNTRQQKTGKPALQLRSYRHSWMEKQPSLVREKRVQRSIYSCFRMRKSLLSELELWSRVRIDTMLRSCSVVKAAREEPVFGYTSSNSSLSL